MKYKELFDQYTFCIETDSELHTNLMCTNNHYLTMPHERKDRFASDSNCKYQNSQSWKSA